MTAAIKEGGVYLVKEVPSASATGYTLGWGLSADGHVTGADYPVVAPSAPKAFISDRRVTRALAVEGAPSEGRAINSSAAIVGYYRDLAAAIETSTRAFLLRSFDASPTLLQPLLPPEVLQSSANDLNDEMDVVGTYLAPPTVTEYWNHGYVYKANRGEVLLLDQLELGIISAVAINNAHQIVGRTTSGGYLYDLSSSSFEPLTFVPRALNDSGVVVGNMNDATAVVRAPGSVATLPSFGGDNFVVNSVNNRGIMVGSGTFDSGPHGRDDFHAFLSDGGTPVNLNAELAPGHSDWHLWSAVAINDSGEILARARRPTDYTDRSVLLVPLFQLELPFLAIYAAIFGGALVDGGGFSFYGGRFRRIPPWDPSAGVAHHLSRAQRDVLSGLLIGELAGTLENEATRRELLSQASRIVTQAGARLYTNTPTGGVKVPHSPTSAERQEFLAATLERDCIKLRK